MKLQGRGVLITGGSQGFGKAVAEACVDAGADLLLCARGAAELEETCRALRARAGKDQLIMSQVADVSDPDAVMRLIAAAHEHLPKFTGLVNNAGVYGPKGRIEDVDWGEWVRAIEINLFGTVLPCRAALPEFRRQRYGKIVNLSGGGATAPMPCVSAYAASKAAVVRFTETVAHEASGDGIDVNAVGPGPLNTRLLEEVLAAGPERVGATFYERSLQQKATGGAPLEKGAALCVYLLSGESDGITGRLISAIWDPWPKLAERAGELGKSDIYTLRRIVPQDRGLNWSES
jgi:NAD(P)-dependent dehydrogenase (short-subunit alcohol dehydrogenase family)